MIICLEIWNLAMSKSLFIGKLLSKFSKICFEFYPLLNSNRILWSKKVFRLETVVRSKWKYFCKWICRLQTLWMCKSVYFEVTNFETANTSCLYKVNSSCHLHFLFLVWTVNTLRRFISISLCMKHKLMG